MTSLMQNYANQFETLSSSEKKIFFFLNDHLESLRRLTVSEIAFENNVSSTTVIRTCHKLGFTGFSELKYQLATKQTPKDDPTELSQQFSRYITESIQEIDQGKILRLAKKIFYTPRVYVVCLGMTKIIGEYFIKMLTQENKSCFMTYDSFLVGILSKIVTKDDLVIIISQNGRTKDLLSLTESLKFNFIETVLITSSPSAPMSQFAGMTIYASNEEVASSQVPYHHTPLLFVIDLVLNTYHHIAKK
ncbi:MurR/RpiR family transcriptional regulator [Listeria costaricensis]|uniref:MurR/RpiR family transcriptional regulator n=1 Tax=Listeria costaricensis TaxID=2026604 RepID=UPI0013C493F3|nr:MurR/RpiR family transcriptional regulator [Listeria costaricensis]